MRRGLAIGLALLSSACATSPRDIAAIPYSDPAMAEQTCEQLAGRIQATEESLLALMRAQGEARGKDVGMLLVVGPITPSVFGADGNASREQQIGALMGQRTALRDEATRRPCAVPPPPRQFETVFKLKDPP